ncbi:MAG: class I adenylate-forming enzyme family protein [Acidimicrobiales bacterium]
MFADVVREAGRRFGDTPAFVTEEGDVLSYADLDRLSDEAAVGMSRLGIGKGDVVALMLGSGPGYVVAYAAAAKIGAITAGVNEKLSPTEQQACLTVARPALVIAAPSAADGPAPAPCDPPAAGACAAGASAAGARVVVSESCGPASTLLRELRVPGGKPPPLEDDPDRPVAIVFTSGTTGLPKGAVFCERQLDAISEADGGRKFGAGGRGLGSTSMAHLATMTKLPQSLRGGGTTFLMKRWSAGEALRLVELHKITSLGGIPTQVALMLRHRSFDSTDTSSVRIIALGGGPSAPALVREARQRFGVPVVVRYTCTEAGVGTGTLPDDPPEDAEETVGKPRGDVEVTIREPTSSAAGDPLPAGDMLPTDDPLPAGKIGEVCLRSPALMAGYFEDAAATAAVMTKDGGVRTGDLGWLDQQGRLHLCGRAKEMYVRGGYNVFPLEVEAVLCEHPAVAHVAVAARSDPVMGEIGVAVVVAREGVEPPTLEDLRSHAQGRLARYKLPEDLLVVGELPRTAMEKVDRRKLQVLVEPAHTA